MSTRRRKETARARRAARSWRLSGLKACEHDYHNGDRTALAHAVAICAKLGITLPEWAASGFVIGYRNLINYNADSWESILGSPIPKGQHAKATRRRLEHAFAVWLEVQHRHKAGVPIDDELFREIGERHEIGATLAKDYYRSEKQVMELIRSRLDKEERALRTSSKRQLAAARRAIDAGQLTRARHLMSTVETALNS